MPLVCLAGVIGKHYNCVAIGSQDNAFSVWVATQKRPIIVSQTFFTSSVLDIAWGVSRQS